MNPYALISDTHNHAWSSFSTMTDKGVNSRLQIILNETLRAGETVRKLGGNRIIHAGDLYHVRGLIQPEVMNPTLDLYKALVRDGFEIDLIPGNHDLQRNDSSRVSNALRALEDVGCRVVHTWEGGLDLEGVVMVPWYHQLSDLKSKIEHVAPSDRAGMDLIIHAPIDGVIPGLPDHGLTAEYLAGLGYKRVFAGHYHHFKSFGGAVFSIGAIAHHTWSDLKSRAGFLIVSDDKVQHFASHAPSFIEITPETPPDEIPMIVDQNYVRMRIGSASLADIEAARETLMGYGALGVIINSMPGEKTVSRAGGTAKSGMSIIESVGAFIKAASYDYADEVERRAVETLGKAQAVEV